MADIEDRIVAIHFDNRAFERNIASTLASLDKLRAGLNFENATTGFNNIEAAASQVQLGGISEAIENISNRFSAMGAIAFSVLQDITQHALASAREMTNALIEPMLVGGKTRATNIENAKFQFRGLGIDVEKAMGSALVAVKGTAFGLDEAAKVAAQFGASGVDAGEDMTRALRGIAGAAAMTNTSFLEIGDIFTSIAGTGELTNQDLNRFAVRGLNATAVLAKQFKTTEANVQEMARNGEISFDKFSKAMDDAFGEHATKANETYTGSLANMRAAMARLGASFFGPHMEQQKNLFNALTPVIDKVNEALQPLIKAFLEIKGIGVTNLINILNNLDLTNFKNAIPNFAEALKAAFFAVQQVINIAKFAFRAVFPESDFNFIGKISELVLKFAHSLVITGGTINKIKDIFIGFFDALAIGVEFLKIVGGLIFEAFSGLASATDGGGILDFFVKLAHNVSNLKTLLVDEGGMRRGIEAFIGGIASAFERVRDVVMDAVDAIKDFLGIADDISGSVSASGFDGAELSAGRLGERLKWLGVLAYPVIKAWEFVTENFQRIMDVAGNIAEAIGEAFSNLGSAIANVMSTGNFDEVFDIINTGLIAGILVLIRRFLTGGLGQIGAGFLDKINGVLDSLTGTLEAMQVRLKAEALMKLATAIGIMAAALVVLSLIDSEALTKAILAMAGGFSVLAGTMMLLDKMSVTGAKLGAVSIAMTGLATAILILSAAVAVMAQLEWEELAKGLTGTVVLLGAVTLAMNLMPDQGAMIRAGVAITAIAVGLRVMAEAVEAMSSLSWEEMARGLVGVAIALGAVTLAMNLMPGGAGMVAAGAGVVLVAIGLNVLAGAIKLFSMMDLGEIAEGLLGIYAALVVIGTAMGLMPLSLPLTGAGLILVGIGLTTVAGALKVFGSMDLGEMAKGLTTMAVALGILAVATMAMSGTIAGAAAITLAAVALGVLSMVVAKMGDMKWSDIFKGLIGMAAAIGVLAIAALVITPTISSMVALGVALALIGAGFALFGIGAAGIANALKLIADTGKVAADVILEILKVVVDKLPDFAVAVAEGIIAITEKLMEALPEILTNFGEVITALLALVVEKVPEFIEAGFTMLMAFLQGIRNNIGEIVKTVAEIITRFLDALSEKVPEIVDSVFNFVLTIIEAVALKMANVHLWLLPFGVRLLVGFLDGMVSFLPNVAGWLGEFAGKVPGFVGDVLKTLFNKGKDLIKGLFDGLVDKFKSVKDWLLDMKDRVKRALANAGKWLIEAGKDVIRGLWDGMLSMKDWFVDKVKDVGGWAVDTVKGVFGIGSPSKVMMEYGRFVGEGLGIGIESMGSEVGAAASRVSNQVLHGFAIDVTKVSRYGTSAVDALNRSLTGVNVAAMQIEDINPTITPVVDLSNVERSAAQISALMANSTIMAEVSFNRAAEISAVANRQNESESPEEKPEIVREIKFEQNINAPTELSAADIYRNTKTQFAMAKEVLNS